MNSDRNDRSNAYRNARHHARSFYPEAGYNGGFGTSDADPYHYGGSGGDYSGDRLGYSTANDFSGQQPVRGRVPSRGGDQEYGSYRHQDNHRDRSKQRRSDYPETYRSAMGGYMSEHVGDDRGRRDYNQNPNEGNLYGTRYERRDDDRSYGSERHEEGRHKGKGPRSYRRTDTRIQEDINDRLTDDSLVDASEVDVAVQNGEVILSGTVDDRAAKRRAEDIAESVSGVTNVENRIRVRLTTNTNPPSIVTPY